MYLFSQGFLLNRPKWNYKTEGQEISYDIESLYRYIGTENGVFKVFPGTLVPDILYDPREDRWYTAAVGQSQKYMFITHPNQNTSIVTLAKAFHQTRYTHLTHQSRQMYKIISTLYTICLHKVHSSSQIQSQFHMDMNILNYNDLSLTPSQMHV